MAQEVFFFFFFNGKLLKEKLGKKEENTGVPRATWVP